MKKKNYKEICLQSILAPSTLSTIIKTYSISLMRSRGCKCAMREQSPSQMGVESEQIAFRARAKHEV